MEQVKRVLLVVLVLFVVLYAGICAALFASQRSFIYFPQLRSNQTSSTLMTLQTSAGTALISSRPQSGPGAVIYFGGNAEDVS